MIKIDCDVLVIGGGGAGLRAALEAKNNEVDVVLLQKGCLGSSGITACGTAEVAGYASPDGAKDPEDNPDVHYKDIIESGKGVCNKELAKILVEEASSSIKDLRSFGVEFVKDENNQEIISRGCFATKARNRKIKGHGKSISIALARKVRLSDIRVFENSFACDLVVSNNRCVGAIVLLHNVKELVFVNSCTTILATGGAGQLFERNLNPWDATGDGYAMGYRAGARLTNLEFMQAGFGTIQPFYNIINPWLWSFLPRLYNQEDEDFLKEYIPSDISQNECMFAKRSHYPFSIIDNSKYLEMSVLNECKKKDNDLNYVFLDFRNKSTTNCTDEDLEKLWQISYEYFLRKGCDLIETSIKVGIFAQSFNGGLVIDQNGQTTVPGLFAVGECAAGPYGADRLGGNMLLSCQVFGKRAGQKAACDAKKIVLARPKSNEIKKACSFISNISKFKKKGIETNFEQIDNLITYLKKLSLDLLIVKTEKKLLNLIENVNLLQERLSLCSFPTKDFIKVLQFNNLLYVAKIIATSSLYRKESRGSHYRSDFPYSKKEYCLNLYVLKGGKGPKILLEN